MGLKLIKVQSNNGETLTGEVFSDDIQRAELYQQEGFHHIPVADADGILLPLGRGASHGIVICPAQRDAVSNSAGETVIYSVTSSGSVKAKVTLDGNGNVTIDAPGSATIKFGAAAIEPLIKGQAYITAENAFLTGLTALLTALTTYAQAIQPIADPGGTATTTLVGAINTFAGIVSTFIGALITALSQKSFTE